MREAIVTDASVLIGLSRIGHLPVLPRTYATVLAPPAVVREFGEAVQWLVVVAPEAGRAEAFRAEGFGPGESEAMALAQERPGVTIVLDERRARAFARRLGLTVIGTGGILVEAKASGVVSEIRPLLDALVASGFRIEPRIYRDLLRLADEPADS